MTGQLPPPLSYSPHVLVEYVETAMLVEDINHMSIAELTSRWPAGNRPSATDTSTIRPDIAARAELMPGIYPYRADEQGIERRSDVNSTVYDFLLLLSLEHAPYRRAREYNGSNKILDLLLREALAARLGPGSEGVRFGTPVQDGRPEDFIEAVTWLADKMGVADGQRDRPPDDNDAGVDVVVWRHFDDRRSGFPVVLAQGTVEFNYVPKSMQVPLGEWKKWLNIGPQPLTALGIPFDIANGDDRWMKVAGNAALIYDRARICGDLAGVDLTAYEEWEEMRAFVVEQSELALDNDEPDDKQPQVKRPRKQKKSEHRDPLRR